jgi:hypothetical protein
MHMLGPIIVVVFVGVVPQGPPPQHVATHNHAPQHVQSGTDTVIVAHVTLPRADPQPVRAQQVAKGDSPQATNELGLYDATAALGVFTLVLGVVGVFQWRVLRHHAKACDGLLKTVSDGLVETGKAVDAARTSAAVARESTNLTHRPKLVVRSVVVPGVEKLTRRTPKSEPSDDLSGQFCVTNVGAGRAILVESRGTIWVNVGLPMERPDLPYRRDLSDRAPLESGTSLTIAFAYPPLRAELVDAIVNRKINMYLVGVLTYRDVLGTTRETYFCRLFDYDRLRFFSVNDPDYERAD